MSDQLTSLIVRILRQDQTTEGVGFFVTTDGLIATCAHVVQNVGGAPGAYVSVVTHHTQEDMFAFVEPDLWRDPTAEDVAILRLETTSNLPFLVFPLSRRMSWNDRTYSTFGFPEGLSKEGLVGKASVTGTKIQDGVRVLQLGSKEISKGFSGAPLVDDDAQCVVGMVTSILPPDSRGRQDEVAFALPSHTLSSVKTTLPVQSVTQRFLKLWTSRVKRHPIAALFLLLLVMSLLVSAGFVLSRLFADPLKRMGDGWNIVVTDVSVTDADGVGRKDELGISLSHGIFSTLEEQAAFSEIQSVGPVTGDKNKRDMQAALLAERTNASVVVYGVVTQTTPNRGIFVPELYINPSLKDTSIYADEIVGPGQFGSPITFTIRTARGELNEQITRRIDSLGHFLDGVQNYAAEDFDQARLDFTASLKSLGQEGDNQTSAVIHEFLAAVELNSKRYDNAFAEVYMAHKLWPDYSRPYLTNAMLLYQQANAQLPTNPSGFSISMPSSARNCFAGEPMQLNLPIGEALQQALQCYDELLALGVLDDNLDIPQKIALNRANIYLVLSFYNGGDYWEQALQLAEQVIADYQRAGVEQQGRLRRVAAHAYARRGLIRKYRPGNPLSISEQAVDDYQEAIRLLRTPIPESPCQEDLDRCYPSDRHYIDIYTKEYDRMRPRSGL